MRLAYEHAFPKLTFVHCETLHNFTSGSMLVSLINLSLYSAVANTDLLFSYCIATAQMHGAMNIQKNLVFTVKFDLTSRIIWRDTKRASCKVILSDV